MGNKMEDCLHQHSYLITTVLFQMQGSQEDLSRNQPTLRGLSQTEKAVRRLG